MLGLDISHTCTEFDHSSYSHSRDMTGAEIFGTRKLESLDYHIALFA